MNLSAVSFPQKNTPWKSGTLSLVKMKLFLTTSSYSKVGMDEMVVMESLVLEVLLVEMVRLDQRE